MTMITWAAEHAAEMQFMQEQAQRGNTFFRNLILSLQRWGQLTPNQLNAVRRNMNAPRTTVSLQDTGFSKLYAAFQSAKAAGLKRIGLNIDPFRFTLAKDDSKNPGYVYIKSAEGEYMGKISPAGELSRSWSMTPQHVQDLMKVAQDPLAAATVHGKRTGRCSCCGRELTDPESIAAGIGPICAQKFGW